MPKDEANAFIDHVRTDPPLQARINALKGADAIGKMASIALEAGYQFSEEEYRAAVVERAAGELSEESLEEVRRELGI